MLTGLLRKFVFGIDLSDFYVDQMTNLTAPRSAPDMTDITIRFFNDAVFLFNLEIVSFLQRKNDSEDESGDVSPPKQSSHDPMQNYKSGCSWFFVCSGATNIDTMRTSLGCLLELI